MGMIGDNRKLLSKVDDFEVVYGMGYVAGSTASVCWPATAA